MSKSGLVNYSSSVIASDAVDFSQSIPYENLKDRVVLITGGASGFGAAISETLARHGSIVILGDLNDQAGEQKAAALRQISGHDGHHFIHVDVTDWQSQAAFFKRASTLSPHGGIDCVIANAGICDAPENASFENPADYRQLDNPPPPQMRTFDVNLTGVMYTTHLAMSYLKNNPGSASVRLKTTPGPRDRHLILISSIAGLAPLPTLSIYCTAKHGVVGLFRALRVTAPVNTGVRVNMICPYFVDTAIMGSAGALVLAGGALAKIEDVVEAATRLIADKIIIGRGLIVGARGSVDQLNAAGLGSGAEQDGQAIFDVYGHDFEQSDVFTRRVIGVTNIIASARGWGGIVMDVTTKLIILVRNSIGI
jgi:NAD(P)-dependent dehydrogenase (short-subunit alcohol dehydrogenase family)